MRLLDWKLRNKIILHILVIGGITAIFIAYFYTKSQKDIIKSTSQQTVELISGVIEKSIFETMEDAGTKNVQSILESICSSQKIDSLRILNPDGKILISSSAEEQGKIIDEKTMERMTTYLSNERFSRKTPFEFDPIIQNFRTIENRKACYSCHNPELETIGVLEIKIDFSSIYSIWKNSRLLSVIVSLAALAILTFIILRLFEKLINKPLLELKTRMKTIEAGDLKTQVPVVKADEIGGLAASFNAMVSKLEKANRRIEELHSQRMEKAEHLASLGEIAAGLAHEIKNPIAGLKGAIEIIYKRTDEKVAEKELFKEMLVQIDRIHQIIQDLMIYARPKEINIRPTFLGACIENAIKLAKLQVKDKKIDFDFQDSVSNRQMDLDGDKIQEVLLNLLLNSIAAIDKQGKISLALGFKDEKTVRIKVSDDGKGIREDQLSQIFQPFFTTKFQGTGLGLSICQKTIAAHGGTLKAESVFGQGATFTILLPFHPSGE